ncbi:MAG TPA: TIGR03560 family F420-dependent LLM class oxidoreductase [Candidatus Binatia bacterium]|nr:TIGR03560 family F420-dependent LLM class oxidoreductase [Candidatus Binatia bacterium]
MPPRPVRFGICLPQHGSAWKDVVDVARACDRLGFDSVWAVDHFFGIPDATQPIFEGWTELTAVAAMTERVRLGHLVLCVSYRHPAVLAKMAATLDCVSGGRFVLGMGAGWHQQEYQAYGLPFPPIGRRLQELDEALAIVRRMWSEEPATFFGEHFHIEDAYCRPRPLQSPHPPILVGGTGERVLLRIVAEHADVWNNLGWAHRQLPAKIEVLKRHCETVKRDFDEIEVSQQTVAAIGETPADAKRAADAVRAEVPFLAGGDDLMIAGTPDECIERVRKTVAMGATSFVLSFGRNPSIASLELFAERVVPAFR